jgi:putative GTP pyrophosphokinase
MAKRKVPGKKRQAPTDVADWTEQYRTVLPHYTRLGTKVHSLLDDLLSNSKVTYHAIEQRVKTVESFAEKAIRDGKSYVNPLQEITDFAGLRVILYYIDDIAKVDELISREFQVDDARSSSSKDSLDPDRFGYQSLHKIVKISSARAALFEWSGLGDLVAEIQIRTVLQHSWAAISHALQYRSVAEVPWQSRRRLSRLSGILELADEEFAALRKERQKLSANVIGSIGAGNLNVPIDSLSVVEFLKSEADLVNLVSKAVIDAGFELNDEIRDHVAIGVSQLVQICDSFGIGSIAKLRHVLSQIPSHQVNSFFKRFRSLSPSNVGGSLAHFVAVLVVFGLIPEATESKLQSARPWGEEYTQRIFVAAAGLTTKRG